MLMLLIRLVEILARTTKGIIVLVEVIAIEDGTTVIKLVLQVEAEVIITLVEKQLRNWICRVIMVRIGNWMKQAIGES